MADRPSSNLKLAGNNVPLSPEFFDNDPLYTARYQKYEDATKALEDTLELRKNMVSPANMALTAALLDPGKTGSFFEAVGRGAGAYGEAAEKERKSLLEDAQMRMQLESMRMGRAQENQAIKMLGGFKGREGAEGTIPEGASGPLLNVGGDMMTIDDIVKISRASPSLGEILKDAYKLKLETVSVVPGYTVNKMTGESKPHAGGEAKPVTVPEIGGTLMMGPEDTMAYRGAKAKGDTKTVYQIIDRLSKSIGPRPTEDVPVPAITEQSAVKPPVKAAPVQPAMTQESMKTESEANAASAKKMAEDYAASTTKFVTMADDNRSSQDAAADVLSILQRNPKVVGLFDKKGFAPAFWNFMQSTMDARAGDTKGGVSADIKSADLQKIVMQVDKSFTDIDIADLNAIAGNLARMELGLRRQTYAGSGMGAVSNTEGVPIRETIGSRYENADSLRRKMATVGRGFKLDSDIAQAYRQWASKPENKFKHLEDFKRD